MIVDVDLKPLFPEMKDAIALVGGKGPMVRVRLTSERGSVRHLYLNVNAMANALDQIRRAQSKA